MSNTKTKVTGAVYGGILGVGAIIILFVIGLILAVLTGFNLPLTGPVIGIIILVCIVLGALGYNPK